MFLIFSPRNNYKEENDGDVKSMEVEEDSKEGTGSPRGPRTAAPPGGRKPGEGDRIQAQKLFLEFVAPYLSPRDEATVRLLLSITAQLRQLSEALSQVCSAERGRNEGEGRRQDEGEER
jgi:hypothetical protein